MDETTKIKAPESVFAKIKAFVFENKVLVILTLVFIIVLIPPVSNAIQSITTGYLYEYNQQYLEEMNENVWITLGITTGIRVAVSGVGLLPFVGENLKEMLQKLTEIINIAWEIAFYATVANEIYQYILKLGNGLEFPLLALMLFIAILVHIFSRWNRTKKWNTFFESFS